MNKTTANHFQGKDVVEHLREARKRGAIASAEVHGIEMPGHLAAGADACKETAVIFLLLAILLQQLPLNNHEHILVLLLFSIGFLIWKTARSALIGWARLERLHRLIEQERWEIEHHRNQEREELKELYEAKGLNGKMLEEVIDVMMADDNRLLRIMLEEELGLTLEIYEHPLKQAFGAAMGVFSASLLLLAGAWFYPFWGVVIAAALCLICSAIISAKLEANRINSALVWQLSSATFAILIIYFLAQIFLPSIR